MGAWMPAIRKAPETSGRLPNTHRLHLANARLRPVADAVGEDLVEAGELGGAQLEPVFLGIDRPKLAFDDVVGHRPAGHHPWRRIGRVEFVALAAAEGLLLDDAVALGVVAGVDEVRRFVADDFIPLIAGPAVVGDG